MNGGKNIVKITFLLCDRRDLDGYFHSSEYNARHCACKTHIRCTHAWSEKFVWKLRALSMITSRLSSLYCCKTLRFRWFYVKRSWISTRKSLYAGWLKSNTIIHKYEIEFHLCLYTVPRQLLWKNCKLWRWRALIIHRNFDDDNTHYLRIVPKTSPDTVIRNWWISRYGISGFTNGSNSCIKRFQFSAKSLWVPY